MLLWEDNVGYCECSDSSGKTIFYIDYYGNIDDFEQRERILEFAKELPATVAKQVMHVDVLAVGRKHQQENDYELEDDELESFMKSAYLKRAEEHEKKVQKLEDMKKEDLIVEH